MPREIRRYGGTLIYHGRDREGALEVVETHGVRALHFGTPPRQSALSLTDQERPELAYVRAMLSGLIFMAEPRRALLLGLGGGTLARFLLTHYADCRIDAVERRAGVVRIAYEYFGLPTDPRLRVHIGEAVDFVAERCAAEEGAPYDLILVDAYDQQGMDGSINADAFFSQCARLLGPTGVFTINLWGTNPASLRLSTQLLVTSFASRCCKLSVPHRGNVIGLGLGSEFDDFRSINYFFKAQALQMRLGLEMPYFLRNFRWL